MRTKELARRPHCDCVAAEVTLASLGTPLEHTWGVQLVVDDFKCTECRYFAELSAFPALFGFLRTLSLPLLRNTSRPRVSVRIQTQYCLSWVTETARLS